MTNEWKPFEFNSVFCVATVQHTWIIIQEQTLMRWNPRPMNMSSSVLKIFVAAAFLRWLLMTSNFSTAIRNRVEISTPLNSWKRSAFAIGHRMKLVNQFQLNWRVCLTTRTIIELFFLLQYKKGPICMRMASIRTRATCITRIHWFCTHRIYWSNTLRHSFQDCSFYAIYYARFYCIACRRHSLRKW